MKRLLVSLVLCALVAGGAAPAVSTAQKGDRQPRELWDKFPLEPSATPSQAAPQPTASKPRVVRDEDSGGISAGALIALLLGAAGIGVAAHTAVRRMSARPGAAEVSTIAPPAALQRARPAEPKATEPHSPQLGWRFAPPRPPSSEHEHATNGSASAAAPAELKAGRPAKEKRAAASPEAAANGAEPTTKPAEAKQRRRAANRKPPAAKPKPAATPKPAAKPKPANGADPTTKPAEPTTAPAEAPAAKRSRRSATGKPPAASP